MIDFHTHLDLYQNPIALAKETSKRNNFTFCVTTSPRAWVSSRKALGDLPNIELGLGLHPEVAEQKKVEKDLLIQLVSKTKFVGEVGLDGSPRYKSSFSTQKEIFSLAVKECERQGGRILSIHSRKAATTVLDILEKCPNAGVPVLHWFSGTSSELVRAIDMGCWFSFGPAGLRSKSGKKLLSLIPLNRLLPESDGPFAQHLNCDPIMPWEAI